jgi:hypothetical protein
MDYLVRLVSSLVEDLEAVDLYPARTPSLHPEFGMDAMRCR